MSILTKMDDIWRYLHYFVNAHKGVEWRDTKLMQQITDSLSFTEYAISYGEDYLKTVVRIVMERYQVILFSWIINPVYDLQLGQKLNDAIRSTIAWINHFKPYIDNVEEYLRQAEENLSFLKGSSVSFLVSDTLHRLHITKNETKQEKDKRMQYQRSYMKTMSSLFRFMQKKILEQCALTADEVVDCKEWYMYRTMFDMWIVYMHMSNLTKAYQITEEDLIANIRSFESEEMKELEGEEDEFVLHETAVRKINKINNEYFDKMLSDGVITSGKKELFDRWYRPLQLLPWADVAAMDESKLYDDFTTWTKFYFKKIGNYAAVEELERKKKEWAKESFESNITIIKEYLGARLLKRYKLTDKKIRGQLEAGVEIKDIILTAVKEYIEEKPKPPKPSPSITPRPTLPKPAPPPAKPTQPKPLPPPSITPKPLAPTKPTQPKPLPPPSTTPKPSTPPTKPTQPKPLPPPSITPKPSPPPLKTLTSAIPPKPQQPTPPTLPPTSAPPPIISVSVKRPNEETDDRPIKF
jgi:hypothetical protein